MHVSVITQAQGASGPSRKRGTINNQALGRCLLERQSTPDSQYGIHFTKKVVQTSNYNTLEHISWF